MMNIDLNIEQISIIFVIVITAILLSGIIAIMIELHKINKESKKFYEKVFNELKEERRVNKDNGGD